MPGKRYIVRLRLREFKTKKAAERWRTRLIHGIYVDRDQKVIAISDLCRADFVDAEKVEITTEAGVKADKSR